MEIGEQPALRHYDIANRTRNRFTGQIDVTPNEAWIFSTSLGFGRDDYDDSYFGLQESSFRVFTLGADFQQPNGLGQGGATTTSGTRGCSSRGPPAPDRCQTR